MSDPLPCLRRTEPSAALMPHAGQRTLAYVPAEQSDIRKRMHEFNRSIAAQLEPGESTEASAAEAPTAQSPPPHMAEGADVVAQLNSGAEVSALLPDGTSGPLVQVVPARVDPAIATIEMVGHTVRHLGQLS